MSTTPATHTFRPIRALVNGLIVVILGFIVSALPGVAIALSIGFDLGPQGADQAEISRTINTRIAEFYRDSMVLQLASTLAVALLVFWRARVCARGAGGNAIRTGLLVAVLPVVADVVSTALMGGGVSGLLLPAAYGVAGYLGAISLRPEVAAGS